MRFDTHVHSPHGSNNYHTDLRYIHKSIIERISNHRSKVGVIREVIGRKELKVVFFGRTSSGKSSAINALLGTQVLPAGLG